MAEVWRRDFRFVWAGESASLVGTQVFQLAMPLTAVLTLDATPGQLGLLGAATFTPYVLLGLPAGVLVDRWQRRGVLILSSLGQAAAIGGIPLLAALGRLTFAWLLTMALLAGVARVFFNIAYRSYLPAIVPPEQLTGANSRLTASESVAEIGGPGLGGLLVQVIGAPFALLVDAVSYLASAAGFTAVRQREKSVPADPTPLRSQVAEGFRCIFTNPYLRAFLGEAASYNLCWQAVLTILALFAVRELDMSPGTLGLVMSIGAVGALLGAALTGRVAHRVGLARTLLAAAVIGDIAPLLLPVAQRGAWAAPLFAVAFFIQGFGITGCNVHSMTIRQTITPQRVLGRTNAAYLFVAMGVKPVGALLGGWLGTVAGPRATLVVGTLGLLSTSLFLILSPLRRVRTLSSLVPEERMPEPAR
ncbi:MFS transporter [Micromonospora sp. WMMD998]|uniref:MFS transporter n=1 Tax=Micromonospora sp. WMMD998 TaxID=3016092 RepID=UPI00249CE7E3|nr:MFS transporter [Micromonospora sp. WMMD998]WFE41145.1 MFS transporter [Micromonospora sp. WMMD998]